MLCLCVLSRRLFLVKEIHLPPRVLLVVHQQEGRLGGGLLGPRQGGAGISCALLGGETGIGVGGGDGSLGRLRSATCQCRAMASRTHVRFAAVVACVNCHLRFSTVGAVLGNFCRVCDWMDRTPLRWFHMLRAVGLVTCGGAPLTSGTMCVSLLLLGKDGECRILLKTHACNCWNTWKCHVATTNFQCACIVVGSAGTASGCTFVGRRSRCPKPGLVRAGQEALLHRLTMVPPATRASCRFNFPSCSVSWPLVQCRPEPWPPLVSVDNTKGQP